MQEETERRRKCRKIQRGEESAGRYREEKKVQEDTEKKNVQGDTERRRTCREILRGEESAGRYREEKNVKGDTEMRRKYRKIQRGRGVGTQIR